jgi:hypothetical protein
MPARLINPAPPRVAEAPAAPSAAPPRPAEDAGQRSSAIIPGDDPGDQQPPKLQIPMISAGHSGLMSATCSD